jgi:type I restriction enzyme S subunit
MKYQVTKIESIADLLRGISYKKDQALNRKIEGHIPVLRANNIDGELNFEDLVYVPKKMIGETQQIRVGDIVFAMSSGSKHLVGKSAIAKTNMQASFGAFCALLRMKENAAVLSNYLAYYFKGSAFKKYISEISKGTNINNLKREHILGIELPLPPLHIQQSIVAKLEALFSELDKGIEQLKTAQQQLRTYRQAVLKAAFEGRLTGEQVKEGELPDGWKWVKLNEIGKWTGGGTPSKQNPDFWRTGSILWVSPKDMKANRIMDTEDKISENALKNSSAKKIQKGSILFVVRSGIIRRLLPIAIAGKDLTTNQDMQSLTLNPEYSSEYVFWYCVGQEGQIRDYCAKDGTTVDNLEVPKLKSYPIPICSLSQQNHIVSEIETRLSVADKMEEAIAQGLQQAEALRQSILKKAFENKLNIQ